MLIEKESFKNILNNFEKIKINNQVNFNIPNDFINIPNIIIYGPPCCVKYS